jgi:hypothetical protein
MMPDTDGENLLPSLVEMMSVLHVRWCSSNLGDGRVALYAALLQRLVAFFRGEMPEGGLSATSVAGAESF